MGQNEQVIWGTSVNVHTSQETFRRFIENFQGVPRTNEDGEAIGELDGEGEVDTRGIYLRALHNLAVTGQKVSRRWCASPNVDESLFVCFYVQH
jgi:hypothetical protein